MNIDVLSAPTQLQGNDFQNTTNDMEEQQDNQQTQSQQIQEAINIQAADADQKLDDGDDQQ